MDSGLIPTGGYMPVSQTPLDLREEMLIGDGLDCMNECVPMRYAKGYDCNYVLRKGSAMGLCACVHHEESGRTMEVITDQPGVQFYTACTTDYAGWQGRNALSALLRSVPGNAALPGCAESPEFPDDDAASRRNLRHDDHLRLPRRCVIQSELIAERLLRLLRFFLSPNRLSHS